MSTSTRVKPRAATRWFLPPPRCQITDVSEYGVLGPETATRMRRYPQSQLARGDNECERHYRCITKGVENIRSPVGRFRRVDIRRIRQSTRSACRDYVDIR